jgi:hypothetical protein
MYTLDILFISNDLTTVTKRRSINNVILSTECHSATQICSCF